MGYDMKGSFLLFGGFGKSRCARMFNFFNSLNKTHDTPKRTGPVRVPERTFVYFPYMDSNNIKGSFLKFDGSEKSRWGRMFYFTFSVCSCRRFS